MRFIATCKLGLESTVARQLRQLALDVERVEDARVFFTGGFDAMARALLWLRTAERVLLVVGSFRAETFGELFDGVRALDFVVKPMTYETFAYKFRRAVEAASKRAKDTIVVSSHGGKRRLFVSDIDYVEVVNHKLIYHLGAERVEVWSSMKSAREQLEKYGFAPCSASFLVNMRKVRSFAGGDVVVGDGVIKISRKKKEEFLKLLAQYMY